VIADGLPGFIVEGIEEDVSAFDRLGDISRRQCRAAFEERFTADRMASDYLKVYQSLIGRRESIANSAANSA